MSYSSIRKLLAYWNRPNSSWPKPRPGEFSHNSKDKAPSHGTDGDTGTCPDRPSPERLFGQVAKRAFDIVAAIMLLIMFSPTFLLISLAIKIDSRGPVFRRHARYGYSGEEILVWRFRFNEITGRATYSSCLTRVGRVLHSSGLEDLPRLFNVLDAEMSIVGPEPFLAVPERQLQEQFLLHSRRHKVKPGLIGWARVNGCRGEANARDEIQRRIEYDLYYIEKWSFWLDMKIITMAVFSMDAHAIAA
jgi:lipopolysaccharide/colanic/teichoic acid biosynthesis glycosyltransferase